MSECDITPMYLRDNGTVETIERWIRRDDGKVDIAYSYDGGKTFIKRAEVYELPTQSQLTQVLQVLDEHWGDTPPEVIKKLEAILGKE